MKHTTIENFSKKIFVNAQGNFSPQKPLVYTFQIKYVIVLTKQGDLAFAVEALEVCNLRNGSILFPISHNISQEWLKLLALSEEVEGLKFPRYLHLIRYTKRNRYWFTTRTLKPDIRF